MVFEIKRKFLLMNIAVLDDFTLDGISFKCVNLEQFYTQISLFYEIKFCKINDEFIIKQINFKTLVQNEIYITQKEYIKAKKNALADIICKDRYIFKINNLPCNIDVYSGNLSGLVILEIEFLNLNDARNFAIPAFLQKHIFKEITDDESYKSRNLALWGLQNFEFEVQKTLEILDKAPLNLLQFPNEIGAIDGAKITFFNLAKCINRAKIEYLKTSSIFALDEFLLNLRKTRALLKFFGCILDEKIVSSYQNEFKILINNANKVRNLATLAEFTDTEISLSSICVIENDKLKLFLTSPKNENMLKEWQNLTKDDKFYKTSHLRLKKIVFIAFRKQIVKTEQKLFYLGKNSPNLHFFSTKIDFESLEFLADTYGNFFSQRLLKKLVLRAKQMRELFFAFENMDILSKMILANFSKEAEISKLERKISKQMDKFKDKILHKKKKMIKRLSKASKIAKIYT